MKDSDTSLSLPTTTAPTDYTNDPACPPSLAFRSLVPDVLPWDSSTSSDHQDEKLHHQLHHKINHVQGQKQEQQEEPARGAKRLCNGLFKSFRACKRGGDSSSVSSASSMSSEASRPNRSVEEFHQRSLNHFPSPELLFPQPALEFDFRIAVKLRPEPSRIDPRPDPRRAASQTSASHNTGAPTGAAPQQQREITAVSSGSWSGSFGHGKVLAGGYDLGQARGFRPIRIVEGVFVMQTTDDTPAILEMRTRGSLSGPCDVLDALLSPLHTPKQIDPRRYGFRMFSTIKTTDKRYAEIVNCGLWVAGGVWRGDELIIDAYRVT